MNNEAENRTFNEREELLDNDLDQVSGGAGMAEVIGNMQPTILIPEMPNIQKLANTVGPGSGNENNRISVVPGNSAIRTNGESSNPLENVFGEKTGGNVNSASAPESSPMPGSTGDMFRNSRD